MTSEMTSELDTSQFNNTPIIRKVIRKLKSRSQPKVVEETEFHDEQEEEEQQQEGTEFHDEQEEEVKPKSNRGRKRQYHTAEERLAARRLQQKAYRERKKAELDALKGNSQEAESEYSQ